MTPARKLAAILSADVVNYSGQMKADETATLTALRTLRREVLKPMVAHHRGNIFKAMGDGWLVEYPSVSDAVRCAFDIQTGLRDRDGLALRVGVHLGEVTADEDDIYGDGINLAVRLQEAGAPGTVLVSDVVRRSLDERLGAQLRSDGDHRIKGFAEPVSTWRWSPPDAAPQRVAPDTRDRSLMIGVLPFDNLSSDAEHEFFADGITEEIITTLSKLPDLLVVARNSTFVYKGRSVDIREVGREQGVDLVLEGSVRQSGHRVRITAQLIDTKTGMHLWADRYDRHIEDVFEVQDEIALRIATELHVELLEGEMARFRGAGTTNLAAWGEQLQAAEASRKITRDSYRAARRRAEAAIALDLGYSAPLCTLGFVCTVEARHGFRPRDDALSEGRTCALKALELESYNPDAHAILGFCDAIEGKLDTAIAQFNAALALNPNHADVAARLSLTLSFAGQIPEAIRVARQAITLNPHYPGWYAGVLGFALRLDGQYDAAIDAFREYGQMVDGFGLVDLVIAYEQSGRHDDARTAAAQVPNHRPGFSVSAWARTQLYADPAMLERDCAALRAAGLPD